MAKRLTDKEKQRIRELCEAGESCNDIAKMLKRSSDSISRVAKEIGHRFGHSNLARAHESRTAYCAERRASIAAKFQEVAEKLLDEIEGEYLVYNFGGRDNTYEEHLLPSPPVEAKRQLVQAAREAIRTVIDIDKHDNRDAENTSEVAAWLAMMRGET